MRLNEIERKLKIIKKDKQIIAVLLFGSYITNRPYARDIDICLVLDKKYSNKEMTEKRIKYYGSLPDKFDIQIFQQLPLYIRKRILEHGKVIFCNDEDKLYGIAYATIKEYDQFRSKYIDYIENVLK